MMPTTYDVIYLGRSDTAIDPIEGNTVSEDVGLLLGSSFGSLENPLFQNIQTMSPSGQPGNAYDVNNTVTNDRFIVDGTVYTTDGVGNYTATLTYADGTTATATAKIIQATTGDIFLLPEVSGQFANQALLSVQPIQSIRFDALGVQGGSMSVDRLANAFSDGVAGTDAGQFMQVGFVDADGTRITAGPDVISGNGGNDAIFAGSGDDTIYGGAGVDFIQADNGDDLIFGGVGGDNLRGNRGNDTIYGGDDNDYIEGGDDDDLIFGDAGDDDIRAGDGQDTVYGGDGGEYIDAGAGDDLIFGDAGNDDIRAGDGSDSIYGGDGGEYIDAGAGNDLIFGDAGDDDIRAGDGIDSIYGGDGGEFIDAGAGDDLIFGDAGDDDIRGGDGSDSIFGGDGGEFIDAGAGNDVIFGDTGDDDIRAGDGQDTVYGGDGGEYIDAGAGDDLIFGDAGDDDIRGGAGVDVISGGIGNDYLEGGAGDDTVLGEDGDDTLVGGGGNDILSGGAGADAFELSDGADTITDFDAADGDQIEFSAYYDTIFELRADQADDGILNQSNTLDTWGNAVDYTDNLQFAPGSSLTIAGATPETSFFTTDNTNVICFAAGTRILTPKGEVTVDSLAIGDTVVTQDNGAQPILWIGYSDVAMTPKLAPIKIDRGALGHGMPTRPLFVSPQHRLLVRSRIVARMTDAPEALVAAKKLVGMPGITQTAPKGMLRYFHILCDRHEIVFAEGAPAETLLPGPQAKRALSAQAWQEITTIFPEIDDVLSSYPPARAILRGAQTKTLVERQIKNGRDLVETNLTAHGKGQGRNRAALAAVCMAAE